MTPRVEPGRCGVAWLLPLPAGARLSREDIRAARSVSYLSGTQKCWRASSVAAVYAGSPRPACGERSDRAAMRSIVGVIRVRGRLRMGGAGDKEVIDSLNHRCRVVFLGAPSPGVRALHARTPTSPRTRGEVRERPRRANIFPGQPCACGERFYGAGDEVWHHRCCQHIDGAPHATE